MRRLAVAALAIGLLLLAAACGGRTSTVTVTAPATTTSAAPPTTTQAAAPRQVQLFFLKGEQFRAVVRTVPAGSDLATEAVRALLDGPAAAEKAQGIDTTLPAGATTEGVTVENGTATVELTHAQTKPTPFDVTLRPARAAQLVYTLTALPGITQVLIRVNGIDRARFEGGQLAVKGALDKHDLSRPVTLPTIPEQKPAGAAPANPTGVQKRLVELRYLPAGAVTGTWDYRTSQAVMAFQAWEGLDRDGAVGPQTLAALETASAPKPQSSGSAKRIEVYRAKGVTLLVDGSTVTRAVHTSSGAPGYETPTGTYSIFRKERNSWSYPYQVWLPWASYFNGGIAFHEWKDVPAHPASHGCVRVSAPEAPFVYEFAAMGTQVSVY